MSIHRTVYQVRYIIDEAMMVGLGAEHEDRTALMIKHLINTRVDLTVDFQKLLDLG